MLAAAKPAATATTTSQLLRNRDASGVVTLTLNRPADYNALTIGLVKSLIDTLEELSEDDSVKVIVVAGAGSNFSSGIDHGELRTGKPDDGRAQFYRLMTSLMTLIKQVPQPIVAKVRGIAASEGCQLVAGCDLAIAGRSARFTLPEVEAGLVCSLPLVSISRAVGQKRALELALTGAVIGAQQAGEIGLVGSVVPDFELDQTADDLAARIAGMSHSAVAQTKEAFYRQVDLPAADAYKAAAEAATRRLGRRGTQTNEGVFQAKRLKA
ncbi:MAG: enoyl-CoA hydratase-related protein [Pseudomonadota bacterium]